MKRHSGFTLIEVLVAMFVFAIAGGLAAMSLHSMVCSNQLLKTKENTLLQLQITMTTLRRDIAQIIDRPVIGASMHLEPAIAASGQGDLAFTRTGVLLQQTHMQRVAYRLVGDRLEKLIWQNARSIRRCQARKAGDIARCAVIAVAVCCKQWI